MPNRNRQIYNLWTDIQDVIGPASRWPKNIRRFFWTKNLKNAIRARVCAFVYINGLNPVKFLEWADLMGLFRDNEAYNHAVYLFQKFRRGHYNYLWAYCMVSGRFEHIDGSPAYY